MPRVIIVVLVTLTLAFGSCKGDEKAKKEKEKEIEEVRARIRAIKLENYHLRLEIIKETNKSDTKIKADEKLVKAGNATNQKQHKVLVGLFHQLAKSYYEEDELKEAPRNIAKLKLGMESMKEDIQTLKNRMTKGMTKKCMEYEGMHSSSKPASPPTLYRHRPKSRISDTVVQENMLRMLHTELSYSIGRNKELKKKLTDIQDSFKKNSERLNNLLKEIGTDHKKAEAEIEKVKKELEIQKKRVADLKKKNKRNAEDLKILKAKAKKLADKLKLHALEIECFKNLKDDVFSLVYPNA